MLIDFENIEDRLRTAIDSDAYIELAAKINKAKKIYLIGNGGLHFVASHMATDLSRLISTKSVYSFDSVGFITSNANDHGFEQLLVRWLETIAAIENPAECLIIGMSCSGNSSNVVNALHWGESHGYGTFMLTGQKSESLDDTVSELSFECKFFHTVEVLCMMIFYELIHATGNRCPAINDEKERLKDSPLRSTGE